jgi:V/A-type H+-transporting ATPase subunit D
MADIKPTRSELIKLKKKIKLARSGHNLLKKKRDGLILEFFELLREAKGIRSELTRLYKDARFRMAVARAVESDIAIRSIALAVKNRPDVNVKAKNIMGVVVPVIESGSIVSGLKQRGYGITSGSSKIDEAALAYEKLLQKIIVAAQAETTMKKVLAEIEKTKRRVNALEFELIPKMSAQSSFIRLRLEEIERENTFRMKRIKAKALSHEF